VADSPERDDRARSGPAPVPGADPVAVGAWLAAELGDKRWHGCTLRPIGAGRSNLTYRVDSPAGAVVLRRPPVGQVAATAHDMSRERRVITALAGTAVPVPRVLAAAAGGPPVDAPCYVMELVEGVVPLHELPPGWASTEDERRRASGALVDVLVALHAVDPHAVGLGDFGRPEGFLARQVRRWRKQLDASHSRDLPVADELHARLTADVPPETAPGVVHGDYRLDNVLVDDHDRPVAVIDWEMATIGDPLTDLALLVVYQRLGTLLGGNVVADASSAAGFLNEDELIERYTARSDRDLSRFGFYLGLASFKMAAILEGIHYRHLRGQTVGSGFERMGDAVIPFLDAGLTSLKEQH
jgi:aminoglycoside phosphotransferase (APT) family kinase protein